MFTDLFSHESPARKMCLLGPRSREPALPSDRHKTLLGLQDAGPDVLGVNCDCGTDTRNASAHHLPHCSWPRACCQSTGKGTNTSFFDRGFSGWMEKVSLSQRTIHVPVRECLYLSAKTLRERWNPLESDDTTAYYARQVPFHPVAQSGVFGLCHLQTVLTNLNYCQNKHTNT